MRQRLAWQALHASALTRTRRRYQDQLIQYIKDHPEFIKPDARRNDILSRLQREPLLDLSISRTTFDWGIPVPDDPKHVMCVARARGRRGTRALTRRAWRAGMCGSTRSRIISPAATSRTAR